MNLTQAQLEGLIEYAPEEGTAALAARIIRENTRQGVVVEELRQLNELKQKQKTDNRLTLASIQNRCLHEYDHGGWCITCRKANQ
jgi:hypothetical protein